MSTPPERAFFASPSRREAARSFLFVPIAAVLAVAAWREPSAIRLATLAGALLMVAAGLFVTWRNRLPWQGPVVIASIEGLQFWPRRRDATFMPWRDLASIGSDGSDRSFVFHPREPARYERRYLMLFRRPPHIPYGARTRDGAYFANVWHEYWKGDDV